MAQQTKKAQNRVGDGQGADDAVVAVILSPLGWLADARPTPLRERRAAGGTREDSMIAAVSALVWQAALVAASIVCAHELKDGYGWLPVGVVGMLALIIPPRVAASVGGSTASPAPPTPGEDATVRRGSRLAVTQAALGLCPASWIARIDRRERDPEGRRGRARRRVWLGVIAVLVALIEWSIAHGGIAPEAEAGLTVHASEGWTIAGPDLVRAGLAACIIAVLRALAQPLARWAAEDHVITGTADHPGVLVEPLMRALSVQPAAFDQGSDIHWISPRDHAAGIRLQPISGAVRAAVLDPERVEKVRRVYSGLAIHPLPGDDRIEPSRGFDLSPLTAAERARADDLATSDGRVEGVVRDGGRDVDLDGSQPVSVHGWADDEPDDDDAPLFPDHDDSDAADIDIDDPLADLDDRGGDR